MKLFKKAILTAFALASLVMAPATFATEARDNDSNAIVYGGAYSKDELIRKVTNGTGKQYQSGAELTNLFNTLGMNKMYFDDGNFKDGRVYKNGNVVVGGKVVATNVYTAGRHYMAGSSKDNRFSYPVYWRHPSVSFASESIPAFVYINYDGSMAFAVIKSCGNPVKGVGIKTRPAPVVKYSLEIRKYNDKNGNGSRESNEEYLSGWTFKVTGPNGYNKDVQTAVGGKITITGLNPGSYRVEEIQKSGWTSTTGLVKNVNLDRNSIVYFGNKQNVTIVEKPKPVEKVVVTETIIKETLPVSGPAETAAGTFGVISLAGVAGYYKKAKAILLNSLKKY